MQRNMVFSFLNVSYFDGTTAKLNLLVFFHTPRRQLRQPRVQNVLVHTWQSLASWTAAWLAHCRGQSPRPVVHDLLLGLRRCLTGLLLCHWVSNCSTETHRHWWKQCVWWYASVRIWHSYNEYNPVFLIAEFKLKTLIDWYCSYRERKFEYTVIFCTVLLHMFSECRSL